MGGNAEKLITLVAPPGTRLVTFRGVERFGSLTVRFALVVLSTFNVVGTVLPDKSSAAPPTDTSVLLERLPAPVRASVPAVTAIDPVNGLLAVIVSLPADCLSTNPAPLIAVATEMSSDRLNVSVPATDTEPAGRTPLTLLLPIRAVAPAPTLSPPEI